MKIAVVGTGYVGLVTGTCFSETGNKVTCIDIDHSKVEKLCSGIMTIHEPGLEKLFHRNLKEGRLFFKTDLEEGIRDAQIIILALPTPPGEDGSADLQYILSVAEELGKILKENEYKVIVDKSTVPVGTAEKVKATICKSAEALGKNIEHAFDVVSNPEFLREGMAVEDFMKPNRVIIGSSSEKAAKLVGDLYAPFVRQGNPVIYMDEKSAELTKYAANAFLATKITFMNEIARLCEILDADVDLIRKGLGTDERIGKRFLFPGLGYGGSCFPKDVKALSCIASEANYHFKILDAVMDVNDSQRTYLVPKIKEYFNNNLKGKHFAVWGLAFKPNTDDIREASSLYIIDQLLAAGATVAAFDPEAMENVKVLKGDQIKYAKNQYEVLKNADALIIATEWNEFRSPDFDSIASSLKQKVIFDGRNLFDINQMRQLKFYYCSIGRALVKP